MLFVCDISVAVHIRLHIIIITGNGWFWSTRQRQVSVCNPCVNLREQSGWGCLTQMTWVHLSNHVLHALLPTTICSFTALGTAHSLQLPEHSTYLSDCNFVTHMLYRDS